MNNKFKGGEKFAKLTVMTHNKLKHAWECKCDCGNTTYATASDLRKGKRKSCGCFDTWRYNLVPGQTFNNLIVISYIKEKKRWKCKCKCGNETISTAWALKTGDHKSCGCIPRKPTLPNNLGPKRDLYRNYKTNADKRGYSFNLTEKQFFKLLENNCEYCGQPPNMQNNWHYTKYSNTFLYNGVDRVDNTKGYTVKNSVSCCKICNNSKATLSLKDWKEWLRRISKKMLND